MCIFASDLFRKRHINTHLRLEISSFLGGEDYGP